MPLSTGSGQVLRSACNRCHAQKLSCQRKDGGPCARCVKANTTCASSASQRNRRGRSLAKQPSRVVKDSMLQSKLDVRERQPRAPSTPSTKISDTVTTSCDETTRELQQMPVKEHSIHYSDGAEMSDSQDGVTNHALHTLRRPGNDGHPEEFPAIDWESSTSTFSTADFNMPLLQPNQPISNSCCILQSLDSLLRSTSPAMSKECGDILFNQRNHAADNIVNNIDSTLGSNLVTAFVSTSASTATETPNQQYLATLLSDENGYSSIPAPNQGHQAHAKENDGQLLQKLVEINVQLFNHSNLSMKKTTLPTGKHSASNVNKNLTSTDPQSIISKDFNDTLLLSMKFLQTLRTLFGTTSRDLPISTTTSLPPSLDPATTLIIYSCYIRVLDLLIDRLRAIRGTLNVATATFSTRSNSTGSFTETSNIFPLALPTLEVCSCSLEDFPILWLRMTLELVEEVLDVMSVLLLSIMRESGELRLQEEEQAMPWRGRSQPQEVSPQALLARQEMAYQIIRDIRREIKSRRRAMI